MYMNFFVYCINNLKLITSSPGYAYSLYIAQICCIVYVYIYKYIYINIYIPQCESNIVPLKYYWSIIGLGGGGSYLNRQDW